MENEKIKLILFGINRIQYQVARECIDFGKCEMIACADNDRQKHNIIYESLEIVAPEQLLVIPFDFILVGAWYSYETIRYQLIQMGIDGAKIMPLLSEKWIRLLTEPVNDIDKEAVKKIFVNGDQIIRKLEEANRVNTLYKTISLDDRNTKRYTDFSEYPLIAHACGGFVNGKKEEYTNSKEAFEEAILSGFRMFECDVWGAQEGRLLLGSRLKMQWPIEIDYTIFSLEPLLERIAVCPGKKVILDIKWNTPDDFYRLLDHVEKLVCEFENRGFTKIREQIIMETFDEITTRYATEKNWECILTDYRSPEGDWLKHTAVLCCKYAVRSVLLNAEMAKENIKYIRFLLEKGINVICYTVDRIEDYVCLKQAGVTSVLTNFLKPVVIGNSVSKNVQYDLSETKTR